MATRPRDSVRDDFILRVRVPVSALFPCSKQLSDYGGHNQRGDVTIDVRSTRSEDGIPLPIWVEDLVLLCFIWVRDRLGLE